MKEADKKMKKLDEKSRIKSFIRRKDCIKKKAQELAILCDIQVCMLSFGPDGNCETWPENRNAVVGMIQSYKEFHQDRRGVSTKKVDSVDREFEKAIDDLLLLREVDLKMDELNQRIHFFKMMSAREEHSGVQKETDIGSGSFCGQSGAMGLSFGTTQEEEIDMGTGSFCGQGGGMGMSFGTAQEEEIEMGSGSFCEQSGGMGMSFGTAQEEELAMGSESFCVESGETGMSFGAAEEEMIDTGSASFCGEDGLFCGIQLLWPYLDAPIDYC